MLELTQIEQEKCVKSMSSACWLCVCIWTHLMWKK